MVKKSLSLALCALSALSALSGETPFKSLKLTGAMNAGGYAITNLAPGLLPSSPATVAQVNETNVADTAAVKAWAAGVVDDAVTAEAVLRAAGDTVAQTNLQAALTAESLARLSGDLVALTNWQAVVYSLTNGATLGATALQPSWAATGTVANAVNADNAGTAGMAMELLRAGPEADGVALDAAAAHAATEHSVTEDGGFQAGFGANAADGGAVGYGASAPDGGGAVGSSASATEGGGAVGYSASAAFGGGAVGYSASAAFGGGAVGYNASAAYGGAVGSGAKTSDGFAGGKDAYATSNGDFFGDPIDAIQLGTGGNSTPLTLQIYGNRLLNADGTIPVERMSLHDGDGSAHADIRDAIDAIPLPPTNAVAGWFVWDSGSNVFWRVSATNMRFYVWP